MCGERGDQSGGGVGSGSKVRGDEERGEGDDARGEGDDARGEGELERGVRGEGERARARSTVWHSASCCCAGGGTACLCSTSSFHCSDLSVRALLTALR